MGGGGLFFLPRSATIKQLHYIGLDKWEEPVLTLKLRLQVFTLWKITFVLFNWFYIHKQNL